MSVLDFPTSPTNGQYYNGFIWNAANETWDSAFAPRAATIPISSPNYLINADFTINQRNFTSSTSSGSYIADRWFFNGATGTTGSRQAFTPGSTPLANYESGTFARLVTTGQTGTNVRTDLIQRIEDIRTLAGKTITVSFWAKAGTATPSVSLEFTAFYGTGGSPSATETGIGVTKILLSGGSTWTRYSATVTMPSLAGKTIGTDANSSYWSMSLWVSAGSDFNARTNSLGIQSNTFDFWGVQVEEGAAPTEFRRNAPSIQAELAACQRYYYRLAGQDLFATIGFGTANASNQATIAVNNPVSMRTLPTAVESSGLALWDGVSSFATTALVLRSGHQTFNTTTLLVTVAANPLPQFRPYFLFTNNNASGFFGVSAEL
jgi:hypothetical protein